MIYDRFYCFWTFWYWKSFLFRPFYLKFYINITGNLPMAGWIQWPWGCSIYTAYDALPYLICVCERVKVSSLEGMQNLLKSFVQNSLMYSVQLPLPHFCRYVLPTFTRMEHLLQIHENPCANPLQELLWGDECLT